MEISAPVPLGMEPSMMILAAPGLEAFIRESAQLGRRPVLMHELGGEEERKSVGPRELLERTRTRLAKLEDGMLEKWGAGARVTSVEEAGLFAVAGFTWFTLELADAVNQRAGAMSLDELDPAIVALEDGGTYPLGWHASYLEREFEVEAGVRIQFSDEVLARAAVKFGPVLALAEEMEQTIRSCWHGRGDWPDVVVALTPSRSALTREEMFFVATQLRARSGGLPAVAPGLGFFCEPGNEMAEAAVLAETIAGLTACGGVLGLALPARAAEVPGVAGARVLDATDDGRLAALAALVKAEPAAFREWLDAARQAFPIAHGGWPISLSEEEVRFLPQVEDGELAAVFLETVHGRQLLLSTWPQVNASAWGQKLRAL